MVDIHIANAPPALMRGLQAEARAVHRMAGVGRIFVDGECRWNFTGERVERNMTKEEMQLRIVNAESPADLDELWAEASAQGFAGPCEADPHGGLTYQAIERRRAMLTGAPAPDFPEPPGASMPGIVGQFGG